MSKLSNKPITKAGRLLKLVCLALVLLLFFILLRIVDYFFGWSIPCPLHGLTGLYCPGCGTARALQALLQLNFYQAFRFNPILVVLLPVILFFVGKTAYAYVQDTPLKTSRWELIIGFSIIILCVVYSILRNLPAFSFLQPTVIT